MCVYVCMHVGGSRAREGVKKGGREMCERCVYVCMCTCVCVCLCACV